MMMVVRGGRIVANERSPTDGCLNIVREYIDTQFVGSVHKKISMVGKWSSMGTDYTH